MQVELIQPYAKNAKKHPKKQIEQIAASIKEFGMNQPIVVDKDNVIIVGHGRLEAAKLLGMTDVPTVTVNLTEEQAKAYRLADNKLNESDWDMELVTEELKSLSNEMLELTGFDKDLIIEPEERDDEVPETPTEPQSKLGDLYELGNHRVLCGDSTKIEDVERLMDGKKADMVFTDPPYSVNYKVSFSKAERGKNMGAQESYHESDDPDGLLDGFVRAANADLLVMTYPVDRHLIHLAATLSANEYETVRELVWVKDAATFHPGQTYQQKHEPILVCKKRGVSYPDTVPSDANTVLMFDRPRAHKDHPTEKPQSLWQTLLRWHSKDGDLIHEPFGGSGATMIACEKTGRRCNAMEIEPRFVDVIVQRYVDYTGNTTIKKNGEEIIWLKTPTRTPQT